MGFLSTAAAAAAAAAVAAAAARVSSRNSSRGGSSICDADGVTPAAVWPVDMELTCCSNCSNSSVAC
jgi:hypothetical protein